LNPEPTESPRQLAHQSSHLRTFDPFNRRGGRVAECGGDCPLSDTTRDGRLPAASAVARTA
jgi:hypothetical protein